MRPLCLLVLLLLLPGCPWFISPYETIPPEVDVAEKSLLVIPFSDAEHTYLASEDGRVLADLISREVRAGAKEVRLVDVDELRRLFTGRQLEAVGWKTVGQAVGPTTS